MSFAAGFIANHRHRGRSILPLLLTIPAVVHGLNVLDLSEQSWAVSTANHSISVPAKVPSHVQLDLLAAGLISDP